MEGVVVTRSVSILGPHNKGNPWLPRATSYVDGVEFVTIDERESGFRLFVHGKSVWQRSAFLEDIIQMRNDLCKAAKEDQHELFSAAEANKSGYRVRKERRAAKAARKGTENSIITLHIPGDDRFDGMDIKVRFAAESHQKLQMELEPDALLYVAERCRVAVIEPKPQKRAAVESPAPGVLWHKQKIGFVWRDAGKKLIFSKVPRNAVGDEFDMAVGSARDRAVALASGACDDGGDGDEVAAARVEEVSDAMMEGMSEAEMRVDGGDSGSVGRRSHLDDEV